ncbi:MAG: FtsQ-type POTRA domain-containing protein [Treponema sp.]|nr:FtsQ-type POTRA domain-containing protein [Treponema sp.]
MSDFSIRFEEYENEDVFANSKVAAEKSNESSVKEDGVTRAIKIIFILLSACIVFEFFFYKFIRPSMNSPQVSVSGAKNYTPRELVELLRPMNSHNWYDFNENTAVSILASVSGISSVSVKKVFPNRIYISVVEREPVAVTFINQGGRSRAVQIDRSGVLFPERFTDPSEVNIVPIISGLPVEHMTEGMRIPLKFRPLLDQIAEIQKNGHKYLASVSEICVIQKEYGNYELVLIPAGAKIKVLTDRTLNEDALKYMMVALDVVNRIEPDVSEIDLRYGSVSYRKRTNG